MQIKIDIMNVNEEFRFVRLGNGLSDKRPKKLLLAVVRIDLEFVGEQAAFEGGNVEFRCYSAIRWEPFFKSMSQKSCSLEK